MQNTTNIENYITSKENAWADSTKKSEMARLRRVASIVEANDPEALWLSVQDLGSYSRNTYWTRAVEYAEFLIKTDHLTGTNKFKEWRDSNARSFKNNYQKKTPETSYSEAKQALTKISCKKTRLKANQLLAGGLRWTESFTLKGGEVVGKGSKKRKVWTQEVDYPFSYSYFRKRLKEVGLKPHDLRKIRATALARKGVKEADLCKIFGWESFNTAASYIAPIGDDKISKLMEEY